MREPLRLQLYALQLWACGLKTPQLAIAMRWTPAETQAFQRRHRMDLTLLLELWRREARAQA